MSNDLFQKVVDTTLVAGGSGGLLNADQSNAFIDYMWDATTLGKTVRQIRMNSNTRDIDKMDLGTRITRHASEGVDDSVNAVPTFSKIQVTTEKIRLDWELTKETLEDSIEGPNFEDHLARLMATQLGNDLEDLAMNGDTATASSDPDYAFLKTFDGYHTLATTGGRATVIDNSGGYVDRDVFNNLFKTLPRKYKARRDQLRFWTSSGLVQDYYYYLGTRTEESGIAETQLHPGNPAVEPAGSPGATAFRPFGIPLVEIPLQLEDLTGDYATGDAVDDGDGAADPTQDYHGYVELTHPNNRIWAVKREVEVYREFKPKKDAIEYTVYTRQGVQIDNEEAYIHCKNVRVRGT